MGLANEVYGAMDCSATLRSTFLVWWDWWAPLRYGTHARCIDRCV